MFIKDRQILDGPLIVNEMVTWYKKKLRILKIEFEKAYDSGFLFKLCSLWVLVENGIAA